MQNSLRNSIPVILLLTLNGFSSEVQSFELLSEGAMSSVSAATDLEVDVNTSAGLTVDEDYEKLPFETSVTIEEYETEEVSVDLNFALTEEVEGWASKLRDSGNSNFEVGVVNDLPASSFDIPPVTIDQGNSEIQNVAVVEGEEAKYQQGRITRTAKLLNLTKNSVTFEVESFVERAATLNANPFQEEHSFGSTYISNIHSVSNITITAK